MQITIFENIKKRIKIDRQNLGADIIAGLTLGIQSIPDSMASAILAGISPLTGLYTMIVATPIGALFTSSEMMHISTTSALSLAVGSALVGMGAETKLQAVFALALLVGIIQIVLGLLKMGFLVRFVPLSVMTGFLNGVAVLIILGQVQNFTGFASNYNNRVAQALDTALNLGEIVYPNVTIGLATIFLIILFGKIKQLSRYALILPMIIASVIAALPRFDIVPLVGDVTEVPSMLPRFAVPDFSLLLGLIGPAFAISIIGLVQGAGISQGYPNPDGKYPDPSGDFFGQGMANLATSFFHGMPSGGSLSGTALVVNAGGKSRWANFFVGVLIAIIILMFASLVKLIAMPALAGLLIVIGYQTINANAIREVWQTGLVPRLVMLVTFIGTLTLPLQYAVFLGVLISVLLFIFHQANRIRLVELIPHESGFPIEQPAPKKLRSRKITVLFPYGSLFFAAAKTLEENLPEAEQAEKAAVVFLLRGYDQFGSTMINVLSRYTQTVKDNGGNVYLAGISPSVLSQMEKTGLLDKIGRQNVFAEEKQWGEAANRAIDSAQRWLEVVE